MNSDGFGYVRVAGVVQAMLEKVLGVVPSSPCFRPSSISSGWSGHSPSSGGRDGWPTIRDPENFLALFYGRNAPADSTAPSYLNSTRYAE